MRVEIPPPQAPSELFAARRAMVTEALGACAMVVPAAPTLFRSRDTEVRYRPDSELYYLTGAVEPDSVAVIVGGAEPRCELFVRPRDPTAELWAGPRLGPAGHATALGIESFPIDDLPARLPDLLKATDRIHYRLRGHGELDREVKRALEKARTGGARTGTGPRGLVDPGEILDDLRLLKDEHEVGRLRTAAGISVAGHRVAARYVHAGAGEWEVEAALEAAFRTAGGQGPGFPSIVGSGPNACVLHYVANQSRIPEGSVVLIDAGAEYGMYHGDITRCYPASGRFTPEQRKVYRIVDEARAVAIAAASPGATLTDVHRAAVQRIARGLVELGVLTGSVDDIVADGTYRDFFPHQTSHWLGLDVHDPGDYSRGGEPRRLKPGMVFTVEPGLYFRAGVGGSEAAPYEGIGIRIEDDILITETGCENLTAALPTDIDAVEALASERPE